MTEHIQKIEIEDMPRNGNKYVSWTVFIAIILIFMGLFTYFASADANQRADLVKHNDENRVDFKDIGTKLDSIIKSVGNIEGKLSK